jgi:hypothetical protein
LKLSDWWFLKKNFVPWAKLVLREIKWEDVDWIHLAQDRYQWRAFVNEVMNFHVLYNAGKFLSD